MKVRVEELSPIERKLSIEVESAQVSDELNRAYQSLSRQVRIAGFRPGKVPRRILEQRFKEQVEGDVIHRVVERAYLEAIREQKLEAVSDPQVTNAGLRPDEPFAFEARIEVKPKVEAKGYKGLALKKVEPRVDDAAVDEQLQQMREGMSRLEPVSDRDVLRAGDYALVDYEALCEGKPFAGSKAENVNVELSPGELVESHVAALEGLKVGESKDIDYAFPKDHSIAEVRAKVAQFTFRVKGIKTRVVPELNDEFAKEAGSGATTLAELKTKIRADLERAARAKAAAEAREDVVHKLIEKNPLEVPRAMVDRAVDMMLEGAFRSIARGGLDPRRLGLDLEQLRTEMRPRAEIEVKGALLLEAIAEQEKVDPSEDELERKLESLAEESGQTLSTIRKHFRGVGDKAGLTARLREEKTLEFVKAHATY